MSWRDSGLAVVRDGRFPLRDQVAGFPPRSRL